MDDDSSDLNVELIVEILLSTRVSHHSDQRRCFFISYRWWGVIHLYRYIQRSPVVLHFARWSLKSAWDIALTSNWHRYCVGKAWWRKESFTLLWPGFLICRDSGLNRPAYCWILQAHAIFSSAARAIGGLLSLSWCARTADSWGWILLGSQLLSNAMTSMHEHVKVHTSQTTSCTPVQISPSCSFPRPWLPPKLPLSVMLRW